MRTCPSIQAFGRRGSPGTLISCLIDLEPRTPYDRVSIYPGNWHDTSGHSV